MSQASHAEYYLAMLGIGSDIARTINYDAVIRNVLKSRNRSL